MISRADKARIAVFCGSLYRGGAERVTIYLAKGLRRLGYYTEIITCSRKEYEYDVPDGVERYILDDISTNTAMMIKRLRGGLLKSKIDVLLVIGTPLCIYAIPATIGTRIKVIVSERNDPTHFAGRLITKCIKELFMRRADGYVFQTHDAKKYYSKKLRGRGEIIYNPLFAENIPLPYTGEPEKVIVAVGRLDQQKNHSILIHAFAECPQLNQEYTLVIYGEGVLRSELNTLIRQLGMEERIFLPGNIKDVYHKIKTAALYVLPSNFEGMPNSLIEAMAVGLPCISTDCPIGGPSELIENGVNGYLVPVGDKERLKRAINLLLNDSKLNKKIRNEAIKIKGILDEDNILNEWQLYIERVLVR